jgi:hypothetical protein
LQAVRSSSACAGCDEHRSAVARPLGRSTRRLGSGRVQGSSPMTDTSTGTYPRTVEPAVLGSADPAQRTPDPPSGAPWVGASAPTPELSR